MPKRKVHKRLAAQGELLELPVRAVAAREEIRGEEFFLVESGVIMLSKALRDGRRQVVGFRFADDVVTLGRSNEAWAVTLQAITPSRVRRIARESLIRLLEGEPSACRWLLDLAGGEVAATQSQLLTVGRRNKEERLAAFLLEMWCRIGGATVQPSEILLPMNRQEIADYLGLTTETVSRVFARFTKERLIALPHPSHVKLLCPAKLEDLALGGTARRRVSSAD